MRQAVVLALLITLVSLLTPGAQVLAFKVWVASWLPFAAMLDAANVTHNSDKLVHATLFGCMGFLAVRGWLHRRQLAWVLLGVLWLAPQTEWLQAYIPGRGASLADALADVLGLAVGVAWALVKTAKASALFHHAAANVLGDVFSQVAIQSAAPNRCGRLCCVWQFGVIAIK